ncbi:RNA polymerase sigma factor [Amycolatopsis sp. NPDC003861]
MRDDDLSGERVSDALAGEVAEHDLGARSFEEFFRVTFPSVVSHLIKQGVDHSDAVDVAQESMLAVYDKWNEVQHPRAFVFKVAVLRARDLWRKQYRRKSSAGELANLLADEELAPSAEDVALGRSAELTLSLLAKLPIRQRQVLAFWMDGFRAEEVADMLELSPAAVRSHLRHARRRLAAELKVNAESEPM